MSLLVKTYRRYPAGENLIHIRLLISQDKYLENERNSLKKLRKEIPPNCTTANIKKVSTIFLKYKFLVSRHPMKYTVLKNQVGDMIFVINYTPQARVFPNR